MLTLVDRKIRPDSIQDHMHLLDKRMKNFLKNFFFNHLHQKF